MNSVIDTLLELNPVLATLLRATLILALACIADALLQSRNPRLRVLLSRTTILCLIALPCIVLFAPAWELAVLPRADSELPSPSTTALEAAAYDSLIPPQTQYTIPAEKVSQSLSGGELIAAAYASIAVALLLGSMLGYARTLHQVRRGESPPRSIRVLSARIARDLGMLSEPTVYLHASARVPYVFGCFRPVVVLPAHMATKTYVADLPSILSHELLHIRQRDTFWIPCLHFFKQVLWFHPLAWRLQHVHAVACESVCDAQAAQYIGGNELYGRCLARVALEAAGLRRHDAMAVPMIRRSQVTRRLRYLSRNVGAAPLSRRGIWLAALLAIAVATPLLLMKVVRAQDSSTGPGAKQSEADGVSTVIDWDTQEAGDPTPDSNQVAPSRIEGILKSPVSVVFQDIHLREVLEFVTDTYELNIIADNRVIPSPDWEGVPGEGNTYVTDGRISYINLKNVTLREALRAMLRPLNLSYSVEGNFIRVSSQDRLLHTTFEELETKFYELSNEEFLTLFPVTQGNATFPQPDSMTFFPTPDWMSAQLREIMPELREPISDGPLSIMRYNALTRQLLIHHTPSAHQKFAELIASLFGAPLDSEALNVEELETRTYVIEEDGLPDKFWIPLKAADHISYDRGVLHVYGSMNLGDFVFPEVRKPGDSKPISWSQIDSVNHRLTIHHVPSVLDEFEAYIQKEGWAMERLSESRADTLQRLAPEAALVDGEVIISDDEPLRKGTINFASDYSDGGQITVYSNGKMLGVLNDFLEAGQEAECGETHTGLSLAAEYWPYRYPYVAVAEDGTEWKGHFEIRSGDCETLVLSVE